PRAPTSFPPTFLAQRIATKHTYRVPSGISRPTLWEKVPGHRSSRSHFQQRTAIEARPLYRFTHFFDLFSACTLGSHSLFAASGGAGTGAMI
ncbi:hypothetical protein BKA66DRAFT_110786, partial [Pyrenochaeta sp. MPI-SDFR-AT-0127]